MFSYNLPACVYFCATLLIASTTSILGQQHFYRKPWPTYSLQNMPQTQFRCHDKILGGYYADAETQCQMFHVCVKVAGVGVQDFRFLCPNGTAFDQEAQICADWGDVDCEQSVLYYGSDNFDLYRIGSGFESKRAPLAEEEEATFHLQRAESADIRRSKETRIDQKSRPDQPPNYSKTRNSFNSYVNLNSDNQQHNQQKHQPHEQQQQKKLVDVVKRPIVNYYTPTTSTTTTTTERYNDESKQDTDDIFKGSHSSHFFANRNGGREDDFIDHPAAKAKFNDFTDFNKKSTEASTTSGKVRGAQPTRSKRPTQTVATSTTTTTTTSTTVLPKLTKKVTLHASYNSDFFDYNQYKSTTEASTTQTAAAPTRASYSNANRFSFGVAGAAAAPAADYQTQEKIVPTTYNPGNSIYRVKTTTPKYTEVKRVSTKNNNAYTTDQNQQFTATKSYNKPTISARKSQKLERTHQKLLGPQNSTFVNHNEFTEFAKVKTPPQQTQPQPFQPAQVFRAPPVTQQNIEPQYHRTRGGQQQQQQQQQQQEQKLQPQKSRVNNQNPSPFTAPTQAQSKQIQRGNGVTTSAVHTTVKDKVKTTISPELRPRGFTSRGSINYKATTQRNGELYTPTTTTGVKKFSTLVPKDQYAPTTFKPTTYKKSYDNYFNYQTQQTVKPAAVNKPQKSAYGTTTNTPTTANPYYNVDEDDGQYHPELYEIDFPKNRLSTQRTSITTSAPYTSTTTSTRKPPHVASNYNIQNPQTHLKTQQQSAFQKQQEQQQQAIPVDLSDEEELFKTAHSLNFGAASINKLRADIFKAEKTSQQYNSQYSPNLETSSSPKAAFTSSTTTTRASYSTSTPSTTIYTYPTYPSTTITTSRPYQTSTTLAITSTDFTTTKRPFTYPTTTTTLRTTTYAPPAVAAKPSSKSTGKKGKGKKSSKKSTSKRPPHADEDTSYDYAYYDTDALSEPPQEYPEYEIAEFARTRKN